MADSAALPKKNDPRRYRVSPNFVLSDFLGNYSAYSRGLVNLFDFSDKGAEKKLEHLRCLCERGLEPIMDVFGGVSISYSYLSPEVAARIVRFQDPSKPSYHSYELGAAADIICHDWIAGKPQSAVDLYFPESARDSPIALAHAIEYLDIPYSRLITYSESPYLCLALSADEVAANDPRKALYENEYRGVTKNKPAYKPYQSVGAKQRALRALQELGLEYDWRGAGYPTYHGGGKRQYQHHRVSEHTVLSDFLFDLKSISTGVRNVPALNLESVQDAFAAAGMVVDEMIKILEVPRLSIVSGYVSHLNHHMKEWSDWRRPEIEFAVNLPPSLSGAVDCLNAADLVGVSFRDGGVEDGLVAVRINVNLVLEEWK